MEDLFQCIVGGICCLMMMAFTIAIVMIRSGAVVNVVRYRERKKVSWQTLAEVNDLDFVQVIPNNFQKAYVKGSYRDHQLTLDSVSRRNAEKWTRIVVSVDHSGNKDTSLKNSSDEQIESEDQNSVVSLIDVDFRVKGQIEAQTNRQKIIYEQLGIEEDVVYLQSIFDLICNLAEVYPKIVAMGGEVVPSLKTVMKTNPGLKPIILQMVEDIGYETTKQWANRRAALVCPECLTRCVVHKVETSSETLFSAKSYYGCRVCEQSQDFLEARVVVARLDSGMKEGQSLEDRILRVNWLTRRTLFDFDEIKIAQATDEDVERFVVQVGNDTDEVRKVRYQGMRCQVWGECGLSENSMRILRHVFENVEINEAAEER